MMLPDGVHWHWGRNGTRINRMYFFKHQGVASKKRYTSRVAAYTAYNKVKAQ